MKDVLSVSRNVGYQNEEMSTQTLDPESLGSAADGVS
jgi:hypothetical protein